LGKELHKLDAEFISPSRHELDISDADAVASFVEQQNPDIILHAAAITNNRDIEANPREALNVNITGTVNLAVACLGNKIRLVYLSTDYVYPGEGGDYSEGDGLGPTNLYAWTKLAGEAAVRAVPNHLIIRTSFGSSMFDYPAAFTDKWASKEYVDVIAPEILDVALSSLTGVLNIGGPRRSIYEYAALRSPDIEAIERSESEHESPADTSLNLSRWQKYKTGKVV